MIRFTPFLEIKMPRSCVCLLALLAICFFSLRGCQAGLEDSQDNKYWVAKLRNRREFKVSPAVLVLNVSWNATQWVNSGDKLLFHACVRHASASIGDAFNVHLYWLFPSFMTFRGLIQTIGPEISTRVDSFRIKFEVHHLAHHKEICFSPIFVFDPESSLKSGRHFVVMHTQLSWKDYADRPEYIPSNTLHTRPFNTYSIEVEIPGCSKKLGISNGYIKDHQMTSSSHMLGYEAFRGKMDGRGLWCASVLNNNQYLQVDFIHQVRITKITVRGENVSTHGVEQFVLEYTRDNKRWENYTKYGSLKVFHNVLEDGMINSHWILNPFNAYSIRIRPTSWNNSMCLAVELYGCEDRQSSATCNIPLGMESGFITDNALSTSQNNGNPQDGRLNEKKQGRLNGWLASPYVLGDYLQIDLAVLYRITKIGIQGGSIATKDATQFVRQYTMMFSNDSHTWSNYSEDGHTRVFDGPSNSDMANYPTFDRLAVPVATRFIRIFPRAQDGLRVMRLEIYGCLKEPMPSFPVPKEFARRLYLLNEKTGDFYACLYTNDRSDSSCKHTKDGYYWDNLSSRIVNILAFDHMREILYAVDRSNIYLQSSDFGDNWTAISHSQWRKIKSMPNIILARKVPDNLLADIPLDAYTMKSDNGLYWAVSNTGVHMKQATEDDWVLVASWKCCA